MTQVVLRGEWIMKKMKVILFNTINVAGCVLDRARQWFI